MTCLEVIMRFATTQRSCYMQRLSSCSSCVCQDTFDQATSHSERIEKLRTVDVTVNVHNIILKMDAEIDDSVDVQQALLDKLMQYGDSLLDTDDYEQRKASVSNKSKKKHKKKKSQNEHQEDTIHTQSTGLVQQSSEKVKKKQKKSKQTEDDGEPTNEQTRKKKRKYLEDLEEELRTFKEQSQNVVSGDDTECAIEEDNAAKSEGPEVIVFDDPSKRKKKKREEETQEVNFDLDKARLEVLKFGYSGFDYKNRKKLEQERAIKLGAKAPKREYVNYKLLQQQLKQKRNYERNKREKDKRLGLPVKPSTSEEKDPNKTFLRHHGFWKDRSTERGFNLNGQVGRYRPGVLWLNRQDIAKVRGKSKKSGNKTNKKITKNSHKTGERLNRTGGKRK